MPLDANRYSVLANFSGEYLSSHTVAQEVAGGFSGALIVRLDTTCGPFCLRGWPPNSMPIERLRGLHRLLAHIHDAGVLQVAVPIPAKDGCTLVNHNGRLWQLEPWMPGCADFHANPNETRLRDAVRCLARWHDAAGSFRPHASESRWFEPQVSQPSLAVQDRLARIAACNEQRVDALERAALADSDLEFGESAVRVLRCYRRQVAEVHRLLAVASGLRFPLLPCLRDVWHDHVLFTGDAVTGLIDPAACRIDSVAVDLARLLGSLVGNDPRARQIALDEYGRQRGLSVEELGLVEVLDRSGALLSAMRWIERRYLGREVFSQPDRVRRFLGELLGRMECRQLNSPSFPIHLGGTEVTSIANRKLE